MRTLNQLAAVAALVLTSAQAAPAEQWTKVRIGTEGAYPPFNYVTAARELAGFEIDIARALCERMQVECEFVTQDWDGIIPALIAGRYDAIVASMAITPERQRLVAFTDRYYAARPALVAAPGSDVSGTTPQDLKGKTVGAQSATTHASYLVDKYAPAGVEIRLYPTHDEAVLDLASGRLDAVMADAVVLSEWLKTDDGAGCRMVGAVESDAQYFGAGVGIALRKQDDELKAMFNKALREIRTDGTYEAIHDRHFDFALTN